MNNILHTTISAIMEVGGTEFELVQFGCDYSLNSLPMADCVLAVGRKAIDGKTVAAVHKAISKLTPFETVKVYFCPQGQWSSQEDWTEGPHLVFEGRLCNLGYAKVMGKIHLVAKLKHWLADLNYSSAVSTRSHPSNPSEFTFHAVLGSAFVGGFGGQPAAIAMTAEAQSINAAAIQEDLWGKAIKPLFCAIAQGERLDMKSELSTCFETENNNDQALAALARIEGVTDGDCSLALSKYTPKLALESFAEAADDTVAATISAAIMRESIESFVHSTLWGKLIAYVSTFGAAVVPLVDKALVVPFVPGLRQLYCKKIAACDYVHVDFQKEIFQPLQGIGLIGMQSFVGGAYGSDRQAVSLVGVGGCYVPEGQTQGMFKFVGAPTWLDSVAYGAHSPKRTVGVADGVAFSSATTPKEEKDDQLIANKNGLQRDQIIRAAKTMYDDYAHYIYVQESLRGRVGSISGKLRFDIAPGSNVLVEGTAEQFLDGIDALAQNMVGTVYRVSIGINAESGQAGTSFQLAHLRTEAENEKDATSTDRHPLYAETFIGAPLLDALQFENESECG